MVHNQTFVDGKFVLNLLLCVSSRRVALVLEPKNETPTPVLIEI